MYGLEVDESFKLPIFWINAKIGNIKDERYLISYTLDQSYKIFIIASYVSTKTGPTAISSHQKSTNSKIRF